MSDKYNLLKTAKEDDINLIFKLNMCSNKIYKDKFIFIRLLDCKAKTNVYDVWSKFSRCSIGVIKWHSPWRAYCYFQHRDFDIVLSDRCNINIGEVTRGLNLLHKYKGLRKEIWGIEGNE